MYIFMKGRNANLGTFLLSVLILSLITPQSGVAGKIVLGPIIKIAASGLEETNPQISYNSVKKDFLIGWIDSDEPKEDPNIESTFRTRARLLRSDGSVSAPRTYMTGTYLDLLQLQFDPEHDRYLMMWNGLDIKYRLLGPGGGVIKATHKGGFSDAVTYHPMNHEYLVASPLRRISFDGIPMKAVSPKDYIVPQLISDSVSPNYFLFYRENVGFVGGNIYFQIIGSDGLAITSPRLVVRNSSFFSVAFDPLKRNFLLLYATDSSRWRAILMNEKGQRIVNPVTLGTGDTWSSAIFHNNHFFVAYNQGYRIFFRELDSNAHPLGSAVALTEQGSTVGEFDVEAADEGKFVIVWSEENDAVTRFDVFARFFHRS